MILLRHSHKPDGNLWGLAAGKVESGESDRHAALRELQEETGYVAGDGELEHLGDFKFVGSDGKDYIFCAYKVKMDQPHESTIEQAAHADHKWVTPEECDAMHDLVPGFHKLLRLVGYVK